MSGIATMVSMSDVVHITYVQNMIRTDTRFRSIIIIRQLNKLTLHVVFDQNNLL